MGGLFLLCMLVAGALWPSLGAQVPLVAPARGSSLSGRRVLVLLREGFPTDEALLKALGPLLPGVKLVRSTPALLNAQAARSSGGEEVPPDTLLMGGWALARRLRARALARPLVVLGEPLADPKGGRGPFQRAWVVDDKTSPRALSAALQRFFPSLKRLGVVGVGGRALRESLPGITCLDFRPEGDPQALVARWKPQVEALLLLDGTALVPVAAGLLQASREQHLPVITTAPWLARSPLSLGVVPDRTFLALRVALALQAAARGAPPVSSLPPLTCRRLLHLGLPGFCGRRISLSLLLSADVVFRAGGR